MDQKHSPGRKKKFAIVCKPLPSKVITWMRGLSVSGDGRINLFGLGSLNISHRSVPEPTRVGCNKSDKTTPFIHDRLTDLVRIYPFYASREIVRGFSYADLTLLCDGHNGFKRSGVDLSKVKVKVTGDQWTVPRYLNEHYEKSVEIFKAIDKIKLNDENQYENNLSARLSGCDFVKNQMSVQPADYFSQVGTNLTMDYASGTISLPNNSKVVGPDRTIRNSVEPPSQDGRLAGLDGSNLANTIGVAAMLETSDGYLFIRFRSKQQAVMSNPRIDAPPELHCSASGVFKWHWVEEKINTPECQAMEWLSVGMREEIKTELHLTPDEYTLIPLAFARELPRGGKPQVFFLARTKKLTYEHVAKRATQAEESWEFYDCNDLSPESAERNLLYSLKCPSDDIENFDLDTLEAASTFEGYASYMLASAYINGKEPV